MIENPTRDDLVELIGKESGTCVSILMRTHESGRETTQNSIRFKNLINEAMERIDDSEDALRNKLHELANLEHDFDFWQHQSAGFALFVSGDFDQRFKLSHRPEDMVYVADHFYTLPLAGAACGDGSTRVLAITWERARLFACDGHDASEITNESFPVAMDELVAERDAEEQLQFSTHSSKGGGPSGPTAGSTAMYHGHGEGEDKIAADRDLYLTRVGRLVSNEIYNTDHPLIVVATEEVGGHFSSTTDVEIAKVIHASPDGLEDQELAARMVESSHTLLKAAGEALTEKLGTAIANESGSTEITEIVLQAANGRVETLLLGTFEPQFGTFDREKREVRLDGESKIDLVNLAVRETLQAGGSVVKLTGDDKANSFAAIYRF